MGNINNPVINRSGTNVFWYQFWYSHNTYSTHIHKNKLILLLLQIYLKYGLDLPKNIYNNTYWFNKRYKYLLPLKYYRWSLFFNDLNGSQTKHRFRLTSGLFYKTRVSLLSYNKWLLVLTQWFEPDKRQKRRLTKLKQKNFENTVFLTNPSTFHLKRLDLLSKVTETTCLNVNLTYQF